MNKFITGGIITVVTTLIIVATGWNFKVTAEIPMKYVTKEENTDEHRLLSHKLDDIRDLILKLHLVADEGEDEDGGETYE